MDDAVVLAVFDALGLVVVFVHVDGVEEEGVCDGWGDGFAGPEHAVDFACHGGFLLLGWFVFLF